MGRSMGRWQQAVLLGLGIALLLAVGAEINEDHDEVEPLNEYEETATSWIAVKWAEEPADPYDIFVNLGIGLEWVSFLCEETHWIIYEAKSVELANTYMQDIISILDDDPDTTPVTPTMQKADVQQTLSKAIEMVYGENTGAAAAAATAAAATAAADKPEVLPEECSDDLPNACGSDGQWWLNAVKAPTVWAALPSSSYSSSPVPVMVIDSGIRTTHGDFDGVLDPDLTAQFQFPQTSSTDVDDQDTDGHGTHTAGIIYARWNNGADTAVGLAPKAQGGMCQCGSAYPTFCVTRCIKHAVEKGVKILNLSLSSLSSVRLDPDSPYRAAVEHFCEEGGLIIAAAGNDGADVTAQGSYVYPAAFAANLEETHPKCVLTVGYVDRHGTIGADSNFGDAVKVAAPGTEILSTSSKSDTATEKRSGSSAAAAIVSGMATLLMSAFPGSCPDRVYDCIVETATRQPKSHSEYYSRAFKGGIANLEAAYECMDTKPECPTRGLPVCVEPKSGFAATACDDTHFCQRVGHGFVCLYDYATDGMVCKAPEDEYRHDPLSAHAEQYTADHTTQPAKAKAEPKGIFSRARGAVSSSVSAEADSARTYNPLVTKSFKRRNHSPKRHPLSSHSRPKSSHDLRSKQKHGDHNAKGEHERPEGRAPDSDRQHPQQENRYDSPGVDYKPRPENDQQQHSSKANPDQSQYGPDDRQYTPERRYRQQHRTCGVCRKGQCVREEGAQCSEDY